MTEPSKDENQADFTPQENRQVEQQAMNPAVTDEHGERVDEGDTLGSADNSADK